MRRRLSFVGVAIASFALLFVAWFVIWATMTFGGECSFEEVKCDGLSEFVASDLAGGLSLAAGVALSLLIAWTLVLRRRGR